MYTTMTLKDVIKCFGNDLSKMPKGSFVQSDPIETFSEKEVEVSVK